MKRFIYSTTLLSALLVSTLVSANPNNTTKTSTTSESTETKEIKVDDPIDIRLDLEEAPTEIA